MTCDIWHISEIKRRCRWWFVAIAWQQARDYKVHGNVRLFNRDSLDGNSLTKRLDADNENKIKSFDILIFIFLVFHSSLIRPHPKRSKWFNFFLNQCRSWFWCWWGVLRVSVKYFLHRIFTYSSSLLRSHLPSWLLWLLPSVWMPYPSTWWLSVQDSCMHALL